MGVARGMRSPSRVPAHVLQWMGVRVLAPTTTGAREGIVTHVGKRQGIKALDSQLHVCIDNGPVVYVFAREVTVIAPRSTEHKELDEIAAQG